MAMRLVFAAVLAVVVHGVMLAAKVPWITPKMMAPQSREVTISLVNVATSKPVADVIPAAPKPKPPPKAIRRPKLKTKPTAKVRKLEPPPAPVPAPIEETAGPPQADDPFPVQDDHSPFEELKDVSLFPPPTGETGAVIEYSEPLYDINPSPDYPPVAKRRRYEGTVMLNVLVDKTGRAAEVKVSRSSGYAVLDRSAKSDVSRWRFKPARKGMQTVEMWVQVPVKYELRK
jgi:protein TonB